MNKTKWQKFISYYRPYIKEFLADLFFAMLGAGIMLIIPLLVRRITNEIIYLEPAAAQKEIIRLGIICQILVILEYVCNFYITFWGHVMASRMEFDMRAEIFDHYQKLSFSFFDDRKVGHLMSRATNDLWDICELFHHGPEDLTISLVKLIGSFIILAKINWRLSLVMLILVPPMITYAILLNMKMRKTFYKNRVRVSDINAQIEDNLSGIRVVKSFANEDIEEEKFRQGNLRFLESKRENYWLMAHYYPGVSVFTTLLSVSVVVIGAWLITTGTIAVNDLITFLLYASNVTEPIEKLVDFTEQFQNGFSGFERFYEIMCIEPDIQDSPNAKDAGVLNGQIDFEDVSFHYGDAKQNVLEHVELHIRKGEYVALVGASGAGKTTLCSLIPRFYEVSKGRILADGTDIRDFTQRSLRRNIGVVQQDVYLFSGDVLENIRYGKPDASDEEVVAAAKLANAHDFIMELPDGYHTDIGQRGVKLSGGQKQRISIARVFLKDPPILIFDEATSALDNRSEKIVQQSLEDLSSGRTTLVIAHRLSTIRNAGRILVLTEEGISEEGTHEELIARGGVYASLYQTQYD